MARSPGRCVLTRSLPPFTGWVLRRVDGVFPPWLAAAAGRQAPSAAVELPLHAQAAKRTRSIARVAYCQNHFFAQGAARTGARSGRGENKSLVFQQHRRVLVRRAPGDGAVEVC